MAKFFINVIKIKLLVIEGPSGYYGIYFTTIDLIVGDQSHFAIIRKKNKRYRITEHRLFYHEVLVDYKTIKFSVGGSNQTKLIRLGDYLNKI